MLRKKLITLGLAIVMAIAALSGCKGQSGSTQEVTSETVSTTEATTPEKTTREEATSKEEETSSQAETSPEVMGRVDAEDICKNISINGKLVEFPWTLNKLGEEYEFGVTSDEDKEDGVCAATLMYHGKKIFIVGIRETEILDRDSLICDFSFSLKDKVSLYNFGNETTPNEVIKRLGEPNRISSNLFSIDYIYSNDEIFLMFSFEVDDAQKLNSISITLREEYFH